MLPVCELKMNTQLYLLDPEPSINMVVTAAMCRRTLNRKLHPIRRSAGYAKLELAQCSKCSKYSKWQVTQFALTAQIAAFRALRSQVWPAKTTQEVASIG